jgi:excisionase family DNA binding protein
MKTIVNQSEAKLENLLTVSEVAKLLRISNMTVYRMLKGGTLPAVKVGRGYRIKNKDLDLYLTNNSFKTSLNSR